MNFYKVVVKIVSGILRVFILLRFRGKENIPSEGAFLLCANHRALHDPIIIAAGCKRQLTFMGKDSLFKKPVLGWLIKALGAFPIRRGKGDAAAVMATLKIMKKGEATLIFPEGTRVKKGERKQVNSGIVRLAIQCGVPIVPAYVTFNSVTYGKPISYDEYADSVHDGDVMQSLADGLMDTIYSLGDKNEKNC